MVRAKYCPTDVKISSFLVSFLLGQHLLLLNGVTSRTISVKLMSKNRNWIKKFLDLLILVGKNLN